MTFAVFIFAALVIAYVLWLAERDKNELKRQLTEVQAENHALILALSKRPHASAPEVESTGTNPTMIPQRHRPGRFVSFGASKRVLENQEPPQRSVNV